MSHIWFESEIRFSITYASFNRASHVLLVDRLLLITSVSPSRTSWHPPPSRLSPHLAWSHPLFPSSFWFFHLPSDWFTASAIIVSINFNVAWLETVGNLELRRIFVFGESKKTCQLDFEELGIVLEDVEIPLLVITMLFSYKGRGTQQIWSSLCLQPDVPLSDLTWNIVQHSPPRH